MASRPRITLRELADLAGVSPSTVSRVLNESAESTTKWASAETAERIHALAESTGYAKNPYAASLRTARTGLIGIMVPRLQDYVLATMYEGVDAESTRHGYFSVVTNSLDKENLRGPRIQKLLDRRVDGLILGDARLNDHILDGLKDSEIPIALMNRRSDNVPSATCDDFHGGWMVGNHFANRGYQSFAVISSSPNYSTTADRSSGFRSALAEHGFDISKIRRFEEGYDADSGAIAMRHILDSGAAPRAVFAVNDFSAIGALGVLRERGYRVPEEIAIAGFNDTPLAAGVGLTTVRSPMHEVGVQAFQLLYRLLQGENVESVRLKPSMVVRTSA